MAMSFQRVAMEQLRLLFLLLLGASIFRVLAANTANACGTDLYARVVLAHNLLALTVFAAGTLLQAVRLAVNRAEAASIAAAARAAGAKAFDAADHAAVKTGIGSVSAKWHRVSLRALLLLAVVLSVAATFLAVVTIEDGFLYVCGCDANRVGYGMGSPVGVALVVVMTLVQGRAARVAVCDN